MRYLPLSLQFFLIEGKITSRVFPGGPVVKNPLANTGDTGSIPDLGRPCMQQSTPTIHHNYRAHVPKAWAPARREWQQGEMVLWMGGWWQSGKVSFAERFRGRGEAEKRWVCVHGEGERWSSESRQAARGWEEGWRPVFPNLQSLFSSHPLHTWVPLHLTYLPFFFIF